MVIDENPISGSRPVRELGDTTRLDVDAVVQDLGRLTERLPVLTVLGGNESGRLLVCAKATIVLGRARTCDLYCSDSGISREHARVEQAADGSFSIVDLDSTNGTYVNGQRVSSAALGDGDSIHLGPIAVLSFSFESVAEHELRARQYEQATRDELTGIFNRRYLDLALRTEVAYARRYRDDLSVVLFDIDHFKRVNDEHGHSAGDMVIRTLAERIQGRLRREDVFARLGGEEFIVLLRGLDLRQTRSFCERLRELVASLRFSLPDRELTVTISLGFACLDHGRVDPPTAMLAEADRWMYEAKQAGRNATVGPPSGPAD